MAEASQKDFQNLTNALINLTRLYYRGDRKSGGKWAGSNMFTDFRDVSLKSIISRMKMGMGKEISSSIDDILKGVGASFGELNRITAQIRPLQKKGLHRNKDEEKQLNKLLQERAEKEGLLWKELRPQMIRMLVREKGLNKEMAETIVDRIEQNKTINKQWQEGYQLILNQAEVLRKQNQLEETREELRKQYIDNADTLTSKVKRFFDTMRIAAKDPQLNKAMFLSALAVKVVEFGKAGKEAFDTLHDSGMSLNQSFKQLIPTIGASFGATGLLLGISMKDAAEATAGLTETLGNTSKITSGLVRDTAKLAKLYGVTNQEAGQFMGMLMQFPSATRESAENIANMTVGFAKMNKIPTGQLIRSIAQNTEAFAKFGKQGGLNMVVASVAAKKMGIELSSIENMMNNILDFENSLNKQMEASVILGKEINLDRARSLALEGRVIDATKEVLHNVGGEQAFNRLNVIQRKALAEAIGVSVADLAKMVQNQDKLSTLTFDQQRALAEGSMSLDGMIAGSKTLRQTLSDPSNLLLIFTMLNFFKGTAIAGWATKIGSSILGAFGKAGGAIQSIIDKGKAAANIKPVPPKVGTGLSGLARGMTAMGTGKVLFGALNLALAGIGFLVLTAGLPGMIMVATLGKPVEIGLKAIGRGLTTLGKVIMTGYGAFGVVALLGIGVAAMTLGKALNLATPAIEAVGNTIVNVFKTIPPIVGSITTGFINITSSVGQLAQSVPNLLLLGGALFTIAGGLSSIAASGVLAMPTIGALTALALASPALIKLADVLSAGKEEPIKSKEDSKIIAKLDELKVAIQQNKQMAVYMDGSKVGYALVTAPNLRGTR